jgi:four helix bundle suffix protein
MDEKDEVDEMDEVDKMDKKPLIPKHGGYRNLKSFQIAQLVYDLTVRFCDRFIDRHSRTHDQMVQAARSGVQNIAEGSQASGTSKKTEIKLTNVARASLEELKLDFEDFLRQRGLLLWERDDPKRQQLVDSRPKTADDVAKWVKKVSLDGRDGRNGLNGQDGQAKENQIMSISSISSIQSIQSLSTNAVLVLIGVACALLDRQLNSQSSSFQSHGGFTERLYKQRIATRNI